MPDARADRRGVMALIAVAIAGVAIRVIVLGAPGFPTDVSTFEAWAHRLADVGPAGFYEPGYFSDYPPAFLYVLWLLGTAFDGEALRLVVKAVTIPFDLGIAALVAALLWKAAGRAAATFAAALWLLGPHVIFAGPYWGQVDAVGTLPLLASLLAAGKRRWALAGALGAVAAMVKPQFGLGLVVVSAAAAIEYVRASDLRPIAAVAGRAALVTLALGLPFRAGPLELVGIVRGASETYPYTSLYAFNGWSIVADFWKPDDRLVVIGGALLALGLVASCVPLWRRRDAETLLVAGALAALAFYFLPTRAHERYLFPAFALLLPFAATRVRVLVPYLILAAGFFLTMVYVFTQYQLIDAPGLFMAVLSGRTGQIALALVMIASAVAIVMRLLRGEARLEPDIAAIIPSGARVGRWELPAGLLPGRAPTRRDYVVALLVALAVLATRGYRLDQPRDMYFDEVYHARTAFELLAQREPYEWTHPHLAKEIMALGILVFGSDRVTGHESTPPEVAAFAVTNDGTRIYADRTGRMFVVPRGGKARLLATRPRAPLGLAASEGRAYAVDSLELFDVSLRDPSDSRSIKLPGLATGLLAASTGRIVVALDGTGIPWTDRDGERTHMLPWARVFVAEDEFQRAALEESGGFQHDWEFLRDPAYRTDPRFAGFYGSGGTTLSDAGRATLTAAYASLLSPPLIVRTPSAAVAVRPDGSELYVLDPQGTVHVVDPQAGVETRSFPGAAPGTAIAYAQGPNRLFVARADEPSLDVIELEGGRRETVPLANGRTGTFATGATALAVVPRTQFLYALADGRLVVAETHGASAYAAIPTTAARLGVDGTGDALLLQGDAGVELVETGRHALAWRLPGVVFGAILAFFLVLLARRLFAGPLVAAFVGVLLLLDGSMFAQPRIGMNDVYVGAFLVAAWYFVVAAHAPRRSARVDLALAGALFGLALASKWVAAYALVALAILSIAATARAFERGRPGEGGPLDLLKGRGLNAVLLFACFAVVPIAIYLLAYRPWFGGPMAPYGWDLVELTRQMYWYHSGLTSPHPAGSPWWSWPFVLKPVYWYYAASDGGGSAVIYDAGNVVIFWAALAATVWCAIAAIRSRSISLGFVVFALVAQLVSWIPITRVLFFYHFFTALPYYLLALAAALAALWERGRHRLVAGYVVVAALVFVFFYPFVSGQPVPADESGIFFILPTWQYSCQFYPSFTCDLSGTSRLELAAVLARVGIPVALGLLVLALWQLPSERISVWLRARRPS